MKILVTGGAGFIGSALIRYVIEKTDDAVVNVDKLTYAGNLESIEPVSGSPRYYFERVDICDQKALSSVFARHQPDRVIHLAAESHVDRSIDGPAAFIETNILGTYNLLEVSRRYLGSCPEKTARAFRLHHVSTDEVFGDLGPGDDRFREDTPYAPSSPYSASKASSDHLVRAWQRTYGLPTLVTNCSNNYGPYQFPEKLIPLIILNALDGKTLPVYGTGQQVRDWLHVDDHAVALYTVLTSGQVGETYNIGADSAITNIDVVRKICDVLQEIRPEPPGETSAYADLIEFVPDRPGHDLRYEIDASRIRDELGWRPAHSFESGLRSVIGWYLDNRGWCERATADSYHRERLGLGDDLVKEGVSS